MASTNYSTNYNWILTDITFCGNANSCPLKETCCRAQNPGMGVHSYSLFYNGYDKCKYYLPIKEK